MRAINAGDLQGRVKSVSFDSTRDTSPITAYAIGVASKVLKIYPQESLQHQDFFFIKNFYSS